MESSITRVLEFAQVNRALGIEIVCYRVHCQSTTVVLFFVRVRFLSCCVFSTLLAQHRFSILSVSRPRSFLLHSTTTTTTTTTTKCPVPLCLQPHVRRCLQPSRHRLYTWRDQRWALKRATTRSRKLSMLAIGGQPVVARRSHQIASEWSSTAPETSSKANSKAQ